MVYKKFNRIVGIVVWYNPSQKERQALSLYNGDLEHVIIVDNSAVENRPLCANLDNITYIPCLENKGVASALNIGCREAVRMGADWVLTMDQDSRWDQSSVKQYIEEAAQYDSFDKVAIFSPYHDCDGRPEKHHRFGRFESRRFIMCSGNLLRLSAWQQTGGFRDDFFIDLVDDEMCCHLHRLGWEVVRTNEIRLTHSLGNGVRFVGVTRRPYTPHAAWRYYYIGRNMHYMVQLYPEMAHYYHSRVRKELKRLLFYDFEDKYAKLHNFFRGLRDGKQPYPPTTQWKMTLAPEYESWREALTQTILHFFDHGQVIYDARNQIRIFDAPDGSEICIKRFHAPRFLNTWIYSYIRQPKAVRAYENAVRLNECGIHTPKAIGYILVQKRGLLQESYLINCCSNLTRNMYEFRHHPLEGYETIVQAFAQYTADMHEKGVLHKDYSPGNILFDLTQDGKVQFEIVDINRMRFDQPVSAKEGCRNLCRLWGKEDFFTLLAREYARARCVDETQCIQWTLKYWRRFWRFRK